MQRRWDFTGKNNTAPDRGARVAGWVRARLGATGMTASEFAHRIGADKRDVQRLLAEQSCGHRLEDKIAAAFKWDFVEAVMSPVCGGDPISVMEAQLAERLAEAAAIHDQIERERAVRSDLLAADRRHSGGRRKGDVRHASPAGKGGTRSAAPARGSRPGGDLVFDF